MHLDEEVKPVAQKPLVLNRGHAVEPLEEEFLLLGGRWKHALRLKGYRALRQAQRAIGPTGARWTGSGLPLPLALRRPYRYRSRCGCGWMVARGVPWVVGLARVRAWDRFGRG